MSLPIELKTMLGNVKIKNPKIKKLNDTVRNVFKSNVPQNNIKEKGYKIVLKRENNSNDLIVRHNGDEKRQRMAEIIKVKEVTGDLDKRLKQDYIKRKGTKTRKRKKRNKSEQTKKKKSRKRKKRKTNRTQIKKSRNKNNNK